MVESFLEEEIQEDSSKKTYARVDQHYKRNKIKYKKKCWYCNSCPIIRKTVNSLGASIARGWGTLKPIAGREKLIGSTGKPRKGVRKKKERKERKKGEKGPKRKEKSN